MSDNIKYTLSEIWDQQYFVHNSEKFKYVVVIFGQQHRLKVTPQYNRVFYTVVTDWDWNLSRKDESLGRVWMCSVPVDQSLM